MIAEDYFSLDQVDSLEPTPQAGQHNRNLSSIVSTIRDDGPSVLEQPPSQVDVEDEPAPVIGMPDSHRQRIRALPGTQVMLKVVGALAAVLLLGMAILIAKGQYPAVDERGLHLADLPAGFGEELVELKHATQTRLAQWVDQAGIWLIGLVPAQSPPVPVAATDMTGISRQQAKIMAQLDSLSNTVEALQTRLDQAQATQVNDSVTRQAEQTLQLKALQAQLAALQQQMAAQPAAPSKPPKQTKSKTIDPVRPADGDWVVNVASSSKQDAIKALQDRLQQQEIHTELQHTKVQGKSRYRLRVTGFTTGAEARQYAARLAEQADLQGAWVSKR